MYLVNILILIFGAPIVLLFVPYKLASWFGLKYKKSFIAIFAIMTISAVMLSMGFSWARYGETAIIYQYGFLWFGLIIFLTFFTAIYALIGRFLPISKKLGGYLVVLLSLGLFAYSFYHARDYKNYEISFELEGLENPLTIYHVPDVHFGIFAAEGRAKEIVKNINEIKPDLVLFNGDFFDSPTALTKETLAPFKDVKVPLYFTTGNHDIYVGLEELKAHLKGNNITYLENDIINIKGAQIVGLDYLNADEFYVGAHSSKKPDTIKSLMPKLNLDKDKPIIVAHHSPVGAKYIEAVGADLFLAGHTHGGQLFPGTLIAKQRFEYPIGLYSLNDMKIYVTQGIGTFGPPLRLGTDAEATIVKLLPKK